MAVHEFLFALDLPDRGHFSEMLDEVARRVLDYIGYSRAAVADLVGELRAAVAQSAGRGHERCRVQFRAQGGELRIVVSRGSHGEWSVKRPLP